MDASDEFDFDDGGDGEWMDDTADGELDSAYSLGQSQGLGDSLGDGGGAMRRNASFDVLPEESLLKESGKLVSDVAEVCGLKSRALVTALLRKNHWNRERVLTQWMDGSEKLLQEVGVSVVEEAPSPAPTKKNKTSTTGKRSGGRTRGSSGAASPSSSAPGGKSSSTSTRSAKQRKIECPICLERVDMKQGSFALACGHRYCDECWAGFLNNKVADGPVSVNTRCPFPGCNLLVLEDVFQERASPASYERYEQFLQRSYVDDNPLVKWCPAAGCNCCVRVERAARPDPVTCACGAVWCFRCADADLGDHRPASCHEVEKWTRKAADESENVNWMVANTKKCPQCRSPIEKSGGCMHMTCTLPSCRYDFCWLCRGPWKDHGSSTGGYYNCNKYDQSKDAREEDARSKNAKTELEHYMFYFHRYESHRNALKVAEAQRAQCSAKEALVLTKFDVRSADTKFMHEATEQLLSCRRVLQWSYVYGYYLSENESQVAERNLFEFLQEQLEKYCNLLSEAFERELADIPDYHAFISWKESVANFTSVSGKFLKNFNEGVEKGLTTS